MGLCVQKWLVTVCGAGLLAGFSTEALAASQMEKLGRGLSVANAGTGTLVCWRLLGTDSPTAKFTLLRDGETLANIGANDPTCFADAAGSVSNTYTLKDESGKISQATIILDGYYKDNYGKAAYKTISLDVPADLTMPDASTCSYTPNDMSVGDLDGDGEYELVVKWDPSNSKDNASNGYTGNVYIDAYKLNGTKLWRIDLGKNIRAGAHYTQFMVYDLDGDGYAEIAMKTSDGTIDGTGKVIGDGNADYRTSAGRIMSGNEYLTVFKGSTGEAITTIDYLPGRDIISNWGDTYGNRSERMLAAVAYLDGIHPSLIVDRGYYTAAFMVAYDFDGKQLTRRWFRADSTAEQGLYGEGNHNISVGDLDGDGLDEIVFGAAAVNPDGSLRYRTGFGHGDALHLSDMDPDSPGLEVFDVHEETTAAYSDEFRGPSGKVIWGTAQAGVDNGRGLAADIDSTSRGFEMWSAAGEGIRTAGGELLSSTKPSYNFRLYWDGDLQDELLDATGSGGSGGKIEKWNSSAQTVDRIMNLYKINSSTLNNYTKANPCISADIFGDWREEIIVRSSADPSVVNIIATLSETPHRIYTLMHDRQYRVSVAWQNVAYNQPPHLGYYLPDNVGENLKKPEIFVVSAAGKADSTMTFGKIFDASVPDSAGTGAHETDHAGYLESGYWNFENAAGSFASYKFYSAKDTVATLAVVFANGGTADRKMNVLVGSESYSVSFPAGGWETWDTSYVQISVPKGEFTLTLLSATSDGGPNVSAFAFNVSGIERFGTTAIEALPANSPKLSLGANARAQIFDLNGNRVLVKDLEAGSTLSGKDLRRTLPAGIYMVKISSNAKTSVSQIIVE